MITSFEPVVDEKCKILILGSMPSVKSLEKQQYYGNKRNHFWQIIYRLFGREMEEDYDKRKAFLLEHNIAVWDVLKSCDREGSSDSKIINPVPNDFVVFFNQYTNIKAVFFNGSKAEQLFNKLVLAKYSVREGLIFYRLPSTSPANMMLLSDKLRHWQIILNYI